MSHTTDIPQIGMTNPNAVREAAHQMGLVPPTWEMVRFYDGRTIEGTAIRLPGWSYPVVVDANGGVTFDNFNGSWGSLGTLEEFRQQYTLAVTREAMGWDHQITTQALPNGDLYVELVQ